MESAGELGTYVEGTGTGGGGPESVTQFLYCRDTAGPPLRGGVVGLNKKYGICPGCLPGQGSTAADKTAAPPGEGRRMILPLPGGSSKRGEGREGQDIGPPETEYGRAIYCDATDSGALQDGGETAGTRVPHRWWEQSGINWRLAREKAAATAEQAGANEAASETPVSGSESESDPDHTTGGTTGAPGRRRPWESVDSVGRSGAGRRIELTGGNLSKTTLYLITY